MNNKIATTENTQSIGHPAPDQTPQLDVFRRATSLLTASLDLEQTLANTIAMCLPALGDVGCFDLLSGEGVKRQIGAREDAGYDATELKHQLHKINLDALSGDSATLYPDTNSLGFSEGFTKELPFNSLMFLPVYFGEELLGRLWLLMGSSDRRHTMADLQFAGELTALAAPVIAHSRLLVQQRCAQHALQLSEERLRIATEAGKIGIWEWDITSDQINWSDRIYELHGLTRADFDGKLDSYAQLVHPDDRDSARQKIQAALASGDYFTNEFRARWRDGSTHWISTRARIHRDASGKALRMVGSSIDITDRKRTEAGLAELNTRLEARVASSTSERDRIWRMSQDILAEASFNGYLTAVSPAFSNILGWDQTEILTIPYLELVHPDQAIEVTQKLAELATGVTLEGYEVQIRHKNGHYRWLAWTIVPEGDLLYCVGRDITELRRQRMQRLNTTEKRLQLALEVGRMGAWQWDMVGGQISWWPGMATLHGLPADYRLEQVQDYLQFIHPDDREHVSQTLGSAVSGTEYRIIWPDGSIHWIEGRGEIFVDDQGQPELMAGICMDITKRKRTEQDLRFLAQASAELSELVDPEETLRRIAQLAVPHFADWCAVDLVDEQGGLKRVAVAHADPAKVALGYQLHERFPPNPEGTQGAWQIIRTGKAELVPNITDELLSASTQDPEHLAALRELGLSSYLGTPLSLRGTVLGVIMFVSAESKRAYTSKDVILAEDISGRAATAIENARLYRSLKEADRRKDDFLAMLAHELRNPLAPIGAAADLLQLPLSEERLHRTSEIIGRQVKHMTGLVDDLLDVSRVTQGRVAIAHLPVDIRHALSAAIEQVRPLIEKRLHQLTLALGSGPLMVAGDEKRLVQVLANLLNNAARYTPNGGLLELSLDSQGEFIDINLTDNGIGMEPELVASAFDLFVQGKRTADRAQGGLGLGLALVKSLVELHGGSVQAFSKGPGHGSRFTVRLHRLAEAHHPAERVQQRRQLDTSSPSLRILVVDDNQDAAEMLVMFLQLLGHELDNCLTPAKALSLLEQHAYDVVLLDIGLPGMDGYQLAQTIRQRLGAATPRLMAISGYGQDKDRDAAYVAGIDDYLVKPVDTDVLVQLLSTTIPGAR